ncbi:MAG: hypothetical protein ACYS74_05710 [Planctomycetota bacterium]
MVEDAVTEVVKRYLAELPAFGIHASRAVLAPEFDGPREIALVEKLWQATVSADNRIEPIPCGEKEWETDGSRPILEIARREGIIIAA